jgi:hypothetical protein
MGYEVGRTPDYPVVPRKFLRVSTISKILVLLAVTTAAAAVFVGFLDTGGTCGSTFVRTRHPAGEFYTAEEMDGMCISHYGDYMITISALAVITGLLLLTAFVFRGSQGRDHLSAVDSHAA